MFPKTPLEVGYTNFCGLFFTKNTIVFYKWNACDNYLRLVERFLERGGIICFIVGQFDGLITDNAVAFFHKNRHHVRSTFIAADNGKVKSHHSYRQESAAFPPFHNTLEYDKIRQMVKHIEEILAGDNL